MPGPNGRRLHPRFPIRPGDLGARPACFLLEEVNGLQEQHSYQDVSMHEVRAPGVVRGKELVAKADVNACQAATHTRTHAVHRPPLHNPGQRLMTRSGLQKRLIQDQPAWSRFGDSHTALTCSINNFATGLSVRSLSVTSATGHSRVGSLIGSTFSAICWAKRRIIDRGNTVTCSPLATIFARN